MSSQKPNILFITDNLEYGGSIGFVAGYMRYLRSKKYFTALIGKYGPAATNNDYLSSTITLTFKKHQWEHLCSKNIIYKLFFRLRDVYYINKLFNLLTSKYKFDIIHLNLTWSSISLLLFNLKIYKYKRIITFYGDYSLEIASQIPKNRLNLIINLKIRLVSLMQKVTLVLSNKVISFSNYSTKLLESNFNINQKKIVIIPGVIFINDYRFLSDRKKSRKKYFQILNVSRFEERKGHDLLMISTKIILNSGKKVKTIFCGPLNFGLPTLFGLYENLRLGESILFLHSYHGSEKLKLMFDSDLFVVPSKDLETFGMTIIEALACGTVVIGTPVGAIAEILSKVDKRLIAKSVSAESIAKTIEWFMGLSKFERIRLSKKSKEVVSKYYQADKILPNLEELYQYDF